MQLFVGRKSGFALGLPRLGCHADPFQFALQRSAAYVVGFFLLGEAFLFLFQPAGVVARKWDTATAIKFEDPLGDVVQKVAIVGDGNHGAGVLLQKALQPVDTFGVEVVGGFVKEQQIRS